MYTILTSLLMAGSALAAPTSINVLAPRKDTCISRSQDVSLWKVEKFDYHATYTFTTPAHQNSWGYVNFTLSNPALDYKPVCQAASSQLEDFFYGTVNYKCLLPEGAPTDGPDEASFSFSRPSGELKINQTWGCEEEGARFTAIGGVTLDLNCRDNTTVNDNWQPGQIYSSRFVTCNIVDAETPVKEINAVA